MGRRRHNHMSASEVTDEGGQGTTVRVVRQVLVKSSTGVTCKMEASEVVDEVKSPTVLTMGHAWVLVKSSMRVRSPAGRGVYDGGFSLPMDNECLWA
ncbi:hypothetical protein B296_00012256 [Ensete ventricosum]|uniref:Uncharacterized protein n=1 Tax=Ensete ventricosum TaxID=4639 RepID=A0A427AUU1_ENSVE|nr:hypothetical protein B296_00012256 [Ensete ventricosum]